jgi:hypothetical protein
MVWPLWVYHGFVLLGAALGHGPPNRPPEADAAIHVLFWGSCFLFLAGTLSGVLLWYERRGLSLWLREVYELTLPWVVADILTVLAVLMGTLVRGL